MKQVLLLFVFCMVLKGTYAEKRLVIPENKRVEFFMKRLPSKLNDLELDDLRQTNDSLSIRIWERHSVFTIATSEKTTLSNFKIFPRNEVQNALTKVLPEDYSKELMEFMIDSKVMNLKNDPYWGIDGSYVYIELATKEEYRVVSFWSPGAKRSDDNKCVVDMLCAITTAVGRREMTHQLWNSLPRGGCGWGMSGMRIDKLLEDSIPKTDFYALMENKMESDLNVTKNTNHWEFPLVIVNNKPVQSVINLNQYTLADISSYEIWKPDDLKVVMYGISGSHGVVDVKTK